jgi:DNA-binding NarL/FixJ family response regulator
MKLVKILLADDHAILRDGLKIVLQTDKSIKILGEAGDGEEVIALVKKLQPDIVILDINMPKMNGIEAARAIRKFDKKVRILMLTMYEQENYIVDAISAGINGYIFKMSDMEEFLLAIKELSEGRDYFSEKVSQIVFKGMHLKAQKSEEHEKIHITNREKEILKLLAKGLTSQEIAETLFISYFTVGQHRKNILEKLGLKNTAELVFYAVKEGLVKE